ncbi:bifunctional [glutamate--ammonia ligase]-adenylyl-L-tyrosine phosphorylase/[glutamate--ammonia-ligase] adenylyltransferase [Legionella dresdenensis]|uniref:Bifunctional [glutamate--ammonia ligase]-adenylyl-L-tyrosine phosphorylase/[glutamate--ammonia-ligase] adenylyltransferase n=1 Tax=Legionella dresdenensis TaxID=450200 RepID=A0ABV8CIT6_9GAMM
MDLSIPECLLPRKALFEKYIAKPEHALTQAAYKLILSSSYAGSHIPVIQKMLADNDYQQPLAFSDYQKRIAEIPKLSQPQMSAAIRHFRHYHFLRLMLREAGGLATVEETMASWSDFADAAILAILEYCQEELSARYGKPRESNGDCAQIYVLAMGKLGGRELNYSSDIDLIIAYSASGNTDGQEQISNQQYYTRVVQLFIQLMQTVTAEGFVFRIDLRLRPNGESGALVSSLAAMETYYQEQGRDWERYAMVKARLLGGSNNDWFSRLITPFVYRRYVDFSVIESLRSMKAMIEREIQLNPALDDIKRGAGGIREIEFIIQNFQLIRGGRMLHLRQQNALAALAALKANNLLLRTDALKKAYLFLRRLENCLQSLNDQQTHSLPTDPVKQAQIVLALGFENWDDLLARLHKYQRIVNTIFRSMLANAPVYEDNDRLLANQLASLWNGHVETNMAINWLASFGYKEAERCYHLIHEFKHSSRCRRLHQAARIRLERFMVLLLAQLALVNNTESVMLQVIRLLENIVGRSAYLALLTENPGVLNEILYWFEHSPFITSLLVNYPFLLEMLLEQQTKWHPPSRKQLRNQLKNQLAAVTELEIQQEILRQFKLSYWLLTARAELQKKINAVTAGRFLADLAEVILGEVVNLACAQLALKHQEIVRVKSRFAIIGYGKLGSREMNYNSDLDLVFIHTARQEDERIMIRLTQKIIHMLTTRSSFDILYQVDTRLRPSGEAGLLVSRLEAYIDYQLNNAWTWEHQALTRARIITGNRSIASAFNRLKNEVICQPRERASLWADVQAMRDKMLRYLASDQIKNIPGGLLDLEFYIQFCVLAHPSASLCQETSIPGLLKKLLATKKILLSEYNVLYKAYKRYHAILHQYLLSENQPTDKIAEFEQVKAVINLAGQYL